MTRTFVQQAGGRSLIGCALTLLVGCSSGSAPPRDAEAPPAAKSAAAGDEATASPSENETGPRPPARAAEREAGDEREASGESAPEREAVGEREDEATREPKGLAVSLRAPSAKDGKVAIGESFGLVLAFQNEGEEPVSQPVDSETVHVVAVLPNGEEQALRLRWSARRVDLQPGMLFAAFGRLSLASPGNYELRLWWTPEAPPEGPPSATLALTAE